MPSRKRGHLSWLGSTQADGLFDSMGLSLYQACLMLRSLNLLFVLNIHELCARSGLLLDLERGKPCPPATELYRNGGIRSCGLPLGENCSVYRCDVFSVAVANLS